MWEEGLHKEVLQNPLFDGSLLALFDPHVQIPHDILHSELLGISKKLAQATLTYASASAVKLIEKRVVQLARQGKCNYVDIKKCGKWTGRDIKQFIRIAPIILEGIAGIPSNLVQCCHYEAQVLWYLSNPEWVTAINDDFTATYQKQR